MAEVFKKRILSTYYLTHPLERTIKLTKKKRETFKTKKKKKTLEYQVRTSSNLQQIGNRTIIQGDGHLSKRMTSLGHYIKHFVGI